MPPSPPQTLCDPPPHLRDPCQVFFWASGSPLQAGSSLAGSEDPFPRWCLGGGVQGIVLAVGSWAASVPTRCLLLLWFLAQQ